MRVADLPNDIRLPFVERGDVSGRPVVLLHGFADSWRSFEPVLPHLPPSVRAIAVTQRGHGDASHPDSGYRLRDFAADVVAFLDHVELEAAVLVGHSMGSAVAQRVAIDHPERTLGVVLTGAALLRRADARIRAFVEDTVSGLTDPIDPAFVRGFTVGMLARPIPEPFLEAMIAEGAKAPARVWKQTFQGRLEEDLSKEIDVISAPTLLMWGDRDERAPRSDQDAFLQAIPGARLVIYEGCGHLLHWEEPERFASDVAAFVEHL